MLAVVSALLLACAISSEGQTFVGKPGNGEEIPFDLSLHHNSAIAISGPPRLSQPFFRPSENYYDLLKHLEARKIDKDQVCYIKRFDGNLNLMIKLLKSIKSKSGVSTHVTEEWNIPGEEIKEENLEKTVGSKIKEFCSGYKVFWMKESRPVTKRHVAKLKKRQWNLGARFGHNPGSGFGGSVGLGYRRGGFSATGNLGYSQGGGYTASAGLSWTFG